MYNRILEQYDDNATIRELRAMIDAKKGVDRETFDLIAEPCDGEVVLGTLEEEDIPLCGVWQDCDDVVDAWSVQSQVATLSAEEVQQSLRDQNMFKVVDEVFWLAATYGVNQARGVPLGIRRGFIVVRLP